MSLSTTPRAHSAAEGTPRRSIAIVCFPGLGGSGVVAAELAAGLVARGHRVHVLSTALPERLERLERLDALVFEPIDVPTSPVFEYAPYDIAVASQLVRLVQRTPIDLIHLHYAVPHASSALLARAVLGAAAPAIVTTLHGTDVTQLGAHPSLHAVTAAALAACDGLTAPSSYLRDLAAERFALRPDAIEVIPNFVDAERFAPPATRDRRVLASLFADSGAPTDGPVLFHVSNLRPVKRPIDIVDVLARVRAQLPARAVVVGDGPERDAVVRRADELGVRNAIALLGRRDDFETLLGHADGFLLPSQSEGFGVAALEAMAAGVPVFGYAVGGLPEVVAPDTGALVPCCDVDNLAAAVIAGVGDPAHRDAMGAAARARATELFGAAAAIERYEAYFQRVLAAHGAPR